MLDNEKADVNSILDETEPTGPVFPDSETPDAPKETTEAFISPDSGAGEAAPEVTREAAPEVTEEAPPAVTSADYIPVTLPEGMDEYDYYEAVMAEIEEFEKESDEAETAAEAAKLAPLTPETPEEEATLALADKMEREAERLTKKADAEAKEMISPDVAAEMAEDAIEYDENGNPIHPEPVPDEPEEEDTAERAYETGIGEETDEYGREILDPLFENQLRMSKNALKYNYSKLKNEIMSHVDIKQKFDGVMEEFKYGKKVIFRFAIDCGKLILYLDLDPASIDNKVYPHKISKGSHAKSTPTALTVTEGLSVIQAVELIGLVCAKNDIRLKTNIVPVAYAERYPLNPDAVLKGDEQIAPFDGQYEDDDDYAPINGEIVDGIIEAKTGKSKKERAKEKFSGKEQLENLRQTANTIKASIALTEPIVYFYDSAIDKESAIAYVGIQQVLNDKFLGKIVPQAWFAVAEGSERVEDFNFLAIKEAAARCDEYPNIKFATAASCRLLIRPNSFERLLKYSKTKNGNLILAFDCALLEALGEIGLNAVRRLRDENNIMIMIDNAENAGMKVLTDYDYEYLRFDSRFYAGERPRQQAHLEMMTGYCRATGIRTTSINVGSVKEATVMMQSGVDIIQGAAACEPKRIVSLALKGIKKLPAMGK